MNPDSARAEGYEKYLVPAVFGPWAEFIVELAGPQSGEHVLDVACGTGAATRVLAKRAGKVIAVDIDPAMLEIARRNADPCACIEWRCADVCKLDFDSGTFDLCLCVQGLQHFADRGRALFEIRRTLKQTGRFVASVWASVEHTPGLVAVLRALEAEDIDAGAFRRPFALGERDALDSLVKGAGFAHVEIKTHEVAAHFDSIEAFLLALSVGSIASRSALEQVPRTRWNTFTAAVRERLARFADAQGLAFPYRAHVVIARP